MMTPSRPIKIRKLITKTDNRPERFTQDEALSLFTESDMTKKAYQTVRSAAKRKRADIYPTNNELMEAKRQCYPGNITVTVDSARVPLQDLLDHTALRIIQQEKDAVTELVETSHQLKNYHVNSCVNGDSMALPGRANINNSLAQQRNQMKVFFAPHLFPYN